MPADLFVVSRARPHTVLERNIVHKEEQFVFEEGAAWPPYRFSPGAQDEPSLQEGTSTRSPNGASASRNTFKAPQDIEWVLDQDGRLWIVQSRPLVGHR